MIKIVVVGFVMDEKKTELLSFDEAIQELKVIKPYTLRSWVFYRKIPVVRIGRKIAFRADDIRSLIANGYSDRHAG
jgi:hypothetical protein